MSIEKSEFIWFNGTFVPWDEAKTHILDHGLHYGSGVFEGIRAYETKDGNSAIFRLKDHVERMFRSTKLLGLNIPYSKEKVMEAIVETIRKNGLKEAYIRPLGWSGYGELGVHALHKNINVAVAAWKWEKYLGKGGVRTKISTWIRNNPNSFPNEAKITGGYVNAMLATNEARIAGYDEAIMLDHRGFISEGPGENIFVIEKGRLLTPPTIASILPGITRETVMVLAQHLGYEINEIDINRSNLYNADEAFFTGTAAEVVPIHEVDDRKIGNGKKGPITKKIQDEFFAVVRGEKSPYKHWLTYVYT